ARATADGGISIRLDASTLPPGPLDFLARLRRDPKERHLRIPLDRAATEPAPRHVHLTLDPDEHTLPEGRWDCYILPRNSTGKQIRLRCALAEQALSVGRTPLDTDTTVTAWLPYRTAHGNLALRTWQRPAHAEVATIEVGADGATVTARLLTAGTPPSLHGATVVAVSRQGGAHDFSLPVTPLHRATERFSFALPYAPALARRESTHDLWDLRLRLGDTHPPIPIGRIGGDIVDRKKTDVLPAVL
ncbi:glycosyltransferase family 4 protein, partial [Streptomyces sp. SB3404]|nr:glycosyltransferase family 4 protein [Streptomyces boncukensis]